MWQVLVIAHKLETVMTADRIFLLVDGEAPRNSCFLTLERQQGIPHCIRHHHMTQNNIAFALYFLCHQTFLLRYLHFIIPKLIGSHFRSPHIFVFSEPVGPYLGPYDFQPNTDPILFPPKSLFPLSGVSSSHYNFYRFGSSIGGTLAQHEVSDHRVSFLRNPNILF